MEETIGNDIEKEGFCFCDSTCMELTDCCTDYSEFCRAVDCVLSEEWGEWGLCSNPCGRGVKERSKAVLRGPQNGGSTCGPHVEKISCVGEYNCKLPRSPTQEMRETAKVIPATFGSWRLNKMYNPYKDIRKNLFRHYSANAIIDRPSYFAMYKVTEARRSCQYASNGNPLASQLKIGATVCVECQETAMDKNLGVRCKGHGVYRRETRWNAIMAHGCHGWWNMTTEHMEGSCDQEKVLSFILL